MADDEHEWFDLVKHNFAKPDPATTKIIGTIRGRSRAEQKVEILSKRLTPEEIEAGFDIYYQKGNRPPDFEKSPKPRNKRPHRRRR